MLHTEVAGKSNDLVHFLQDDVFFVSSPTKVVPSPKINAFQIVLSGPQHLAQEWNTRTKCVKCTLRY